MYGSGGERAGHPAARDAWTKELRIKTRTGKGRGFGNRGQAVERFDAGRSGERPGCGFCELPMVEKGKRQAEHLGGLDQACFSGLFRESEEAEGLALFAHEAGTHQRDDVFGRAAAATAEADGDHAVCHGLIQLHCTTGKACRQA